MSDHISVMLVDDHAVVRAGYQMLLKNSPEIEVIAEASNGEEACRLYAEHNLDVVVMDISLPGIGGIGAIKRIISRDNKARILVFSMHEEVIFVEQALQAGACGYITKSTDPQLLVEAIKRVARGEKYIDPELAQRLAYEKSRGQDSPLSDLSTREFEIFCMLAEGLNTSEIAKRLSLSYKTVANYSTQIKNKLNVTTVADIARLAIRHNVIQA
ncbi:MAG: response regulator transcription factor [Proteobacteria bacterium]|nr:response regulator transcription factor [Pseudomonadota bacterium]